MPDLFRTDHDAPVTETVNEQPASHDVTGAEIVFDDVVKKYPGQAKAAVGGLSLTVPAGEMVMFVGPSGCGKTTSLKMINRLINPTSGRITIDGDDVKNHKVDDLRRKIGYVIQGGSLFPHLTVADNVGVVPGLLKWDKKRIAATATPASCRAGSSSASAWPVAWRPTHPSSSWTSRSAPSTRSPGSGCRTRCSASSAS